MKKTLSLLMSLVMLLSITAGLNFNTYAYTSGNYDYKLLDDNTAEITEYTGSATKLKLPSTLDGYKVTSIGDIFYYCETLTSVTIPNSVTSIGDFAFMHCTNLKSVTNSNRLKSIGKYAFFDCEKLENITIPDTVTSIGDSAFFYCTSLKSITIPDGVKSINEFVFDNCTSLTSITIPGKVKSIGDSAFSGCESLKSVTIPDSVKSIGKAAFNGCKSLKYVYYTGTKAEWKKISINAENDGLKKATIIYTSGAEKIDGEWINKKQTKASVKNLTKAYKSFKSDWKKVAGVTGYQIQYSTSKKFTKNTTKSVTIKSNKSKSPSKTVKKLKSKKTYYVRIRTYKNVKINGKSTKVYSTWSAVKSVKTK